jgi:hypothetical protein
MMIETTVRGISWLKTTKTIFRILNTYSLTVKILHFSKCGKFLRISNEYLSKQLQRMVFVKKTQSVYREVRYKLQNFMQVQMKFVLQSVKRSQTCRKRFNVCSHNQATKSFPNPAASAKHLHTAIYMTDLQRILKGNMF